MAAFLLAWQARTLHPSLEQMAYHYAHGKPVQSIDLGVSFDPLKHLADLARAARGDECPTKTWRGLRVSGAASDGAVVTCNAMDG
jgi:hypothetical protein